MSSNSRPTIFTIGLSLKKSFLAHDVDSGFVIFQPNNVSYQLLWPTDYSRGTLQVMCRKHPREEILCSCAPVLSWFRSQVSVAQKKSISVVNMLWIALQRSILNIDSQPGQKVIKDLDPPKKSITTLYKLFRSLGFSFVVCKVK